VALHTEPQLVKRAMIAASCLVADLQFAAGGQVDAVTGVEARIVGRFPDKAFVYDFRYVVLSGSE
jgi:hypothetical protein